MNIAFVSDVVFPFVPGGAQKRIHEIGRRLASRGHTVVVYSRKYWDGPSNMSYEGMRLQAVAAPRNLYVKGRRSIIEAVDFGARLLGPLRRNIGTHDVVVASVFPYFPVFAAAFSALGSNVPLVTTWHEVWDDYWYEYLDRTGLLGKLVERGVAWTPQQPVAVSRTTARRLSTLGVEESEIAIVPNGVDLQRIRTVDAAPEGYDVLFVGRLLPDKNVGQLVRAFDRLDSDLTLGIIGNGPERRSIQRCIKKTDQETAIDLLGSIENHTDIIAQMQAADIFVSPSTREGFGIAVLEARAADCRVVAVDHARSAVPELLGERDRVVEPTVEGLASGIEDAMGQYPPGRTPQRELAKYDWDNIAGQAESVYRERIESV